MTMLIVLVVLREQDEPSAGLWRHPRRLGGSARRALLRARWALEDRRLMAEQRRSVLGPAHRHWRGNSARENRQRWDGWDWSNGGEEWSASPEWRDALIDDVLARWIPHDRAVLEIGPGAGRWSQALMERASSLILVDVSERPLELCRSRFQDAENLEFVLSSGADIPGIADGSIDAVWSFDVFVHIAPLDQASYLSEIARVLTPGGVAVIHHSDGRNRGLIPSRHGWRSPMSRGLFASLASRSGLLVERQLTCGGRSTRGERRSTSCTHGSERSVPE
ncbi:MAG TPA: class I SAM-dependent methyltransferase [Solirubrobacteraceae bacterium]|nr:class I SAM-dependent methyltransferase [Solirubrobacteraceae bacterium]